MQKDKLTINTFAFHDCNHLTWKFNEEDVVSKILQCSSIIADNKLKVDSIKEKYTDQKHIPLIQSIYILQKKCMAIITKAGETLSALDHSRKNHSEICTSAIALIYHTISLIFIDVGKILATIIGTYKKRYAHLLSAHVILLYRYPGSQCANC